MTIVVGIIYFLLLVVCFLGGHLLKMYVHINELLEGDDTYENQ
jgi:hypothetical protein